jgi:magnesium transporter
MIAYSIDKDAVLHQVELSPGDKIPEKTVWIDLIDPTLEEEQYIEKKLNIDTPSREEMDKMEIISPFYKEGTAYFMTITIIHQPEAEYPEGTAITFILTPTCLVSVRFTRPRSFSSFAARALRKSILCSSPEEVLEGLVEAMVNRIADILEKVGNELDTLLKGVFVQPHVAVNELPDASKLKEIDDGHVKKKVRNSSDYYNEIMRKIGKGGNIISKSRESLVSINRMLIFFSQIEDGKYMTKREHRTRFKHLSREIHSLSEYANFLSQKNSFLLDATLGMINVEQNTIIKVFTVAAAMFLPPTLIASIYGMNFEYMPEIDWELGYPLALIMMISSAVIPFFYFKRKGWI